MAIAVFFSLFAAGGAQAGQGNGNGKGNGGGNGSEKSAQASSKAEKTPDQTPNDHPSGKDRTAAAGSSGTQGASTSDPDGMTNGGADKPGGDGGFDDDQDGNNGCGNDDDFEDDNNGWCGGKPKVAGLNVDRDIEEEDEVVVEDATVLGVSFTRAAPAVEVAAAAQTQAAPAGTLAATGRNLGVMAALALAMVTAGLVMTLAAQRPELQPVRVRTR